MTNNLKKLTLSVATSALLVSNAFAYPTINITSDTTIEPSDIYNYNISDSVTLTLNKGGAAYYGTTYFGVISGQGSIMKTGIGIVSFEGNNTYTGNTDIIEGTLELFSGNAIADTGITIFIQMVY